MSLILADIGNRELESLLVCLLVAFVIAAIVYVVLVYAFKQPWGPMAAAITFVVGALLCLL